jgi:hypothetical protein
MDRLSEKLAQWRTASTLFLVLSGMLAVAAPALADDPCSVDNRPAATLLLPYFEVDLNPSGMNTLFSINNASAAAVIANVVVWTDLGVPTLGFQVYLTGYDVQTINLRDVLNGRLPRTASRGQDPNGDISPQGQLSQDLDVASCSGVLPYQALPASFVTHLQMAHSGRFSSVFNGCSGQYLGDTRLRGYVTADTVSGCTLKYPSDPGYFGPGGVATNANVLWGDYFYVDPSNKYSDGENLVRIKAFPGAFQAGSATFYGRYVGRSGADARQPLPTSWGSRYVNGGDFSGGTDVVVWRDSGRTVTPFACGTHPAGFPLLLASEVTFDEEEQPVLPQLFPGSPPPPGSAPELMAFPAEANRIHLGGPAFPLPFNFGWLFFDLTVPNPSSQAGSDVRQSWMETILKAQGQYSVGFSATPFGSLCSPVVPPFPY